MNESISKTKPKKKIPNKRRFFSVPNIPGEGPRTKATDRFLTTSNSKNSKAEASGKTVAIDAKAKKTKANKKMQTKKLSPQEVDKILLEPFKINSAERKIVEDYQWLIKRNILKLMSAAKKKTQHEHNLRKSSTNPKTNPFLKAKLETLKNKEHIPQPKSELKPASSRPGKEQNKLLLFGTTRANTAKPARENPAFVIERAKTSEVNRRIFLTEPQRHSLILHPATKAAPQNHKQLSTPRLKSLFKVFKPPPEENSSENKPVFYTEMQTSPHTNSQSDLKASQKKNKVQKTKPTGKNAQEKSSPAKEEKPKKKNKQPQILPLNENPTPDIKLDKKKKNPTPKLLPSVTE